MADTLISRLAVLCAALLVAACASAPDRPAAPQAASGFRPGLQATTATRPIAAANPLAIEAGREVLRAGGTAIDAAIAVQMVLDAGRAAELGHRRRRLPAALRRPARAGLRRPRDRARRRRREPVPAPTANRWRSTTPWSAAVRSERPACFACSSRRTRQHGKLALGSAVRARDPPGRRRLPGLAAAAHAAGDEKHLAARPGAHAPTSTRPTARRRQSARCCATRHSPPRCARSPRGGADAFYRGDIAADIVRTVRSASATPAGCREPDLAAYQAREREPVCTDYKRWRVCGMPPPSSGGIAVAQMLGILASATSRSCRRSHRRQLQPQADAVHLFSEAGRLAFADRNVYVADPDFVAVAGRGLTHPALPRRRATLIGDAQHGRAAARRAGRATGGWAAPTTRSAIARPRTSRSSTASATRYR